MTRRLVVMACSGTKRADATPLPAIDRYAGPLWQTLRARLAELPRAAAAVAGGDLVLLVLSAEHGFFPAGERILDYDRRLDRDRAQWLSSAAIDRLEAGRRLLRSEATLAMEFLVVGGELYKACVARVLACSGGRVSLEACKALDAKASWTTGGIGEHRRQLGQWLAQRYGGQA